VAIHCRVLFQQISGHGKEVGFGILDRIGISHSQHSQLHLLHQIGGVGLRPQAPIEEGLQGTAVREQPLHECLPGLGHERLYLTTR
jgi:hypothetical protein